MEQKIRKNKGLLFKNVEASYSRMTQMLFLDVFHSIIIQHVNDYSGKSKGEWFSCQRERSHDK